MVAPTSSGGRSIARNTLLNITGQAVPLLVGLVALPFIVRGLGPDRFGILSIAWIVLGYFSLFEFGLSRATTKFVADALGRKEHDRLPAIIWTSLAFHAVLGLIGGIALAASSGPLVEHLLSIPRELHKETEVTLGLMAASVPVVVVAAGLRGTLEGGQYFGLVNAVKIPSISLTYVIPGVGPLLGWDLPRIVLVMLLSKVIAAVAYLLVCLRVVPALRGGLVIRRRELWPLLGFGGWVSVSNTIGPVLMYVDRFLIGSMLSMAAVAYYTAPYEVVTKLWILPAGAATTLLPAFSNIRASDTGSVQRILTSGVKYVLVAMAPIVMTVVMMGQEVLTLLLGPDYGTRSTGVFQVLAVGILLHSLAYVPWSFLQASGRPDLTSKFHLAHVLPYIALAWVFVHWLGILGAAVAWAVRGLADGLFHVWAAWRVGGLKRESFGAGSLYSALLIMAAFLGGVSCAAVFSEELVLKVMVLIACVVGFCIWTWKHALDQRDRTFLASLVGLDRALGNTSL